MKIKEIQKEIHQVNIEKGFWDNKETKNVGEVLMLIVTELAEALESHRINKFANLEAFNKDRQSTPFHENSTTINAFKEHIKDTFEDELADVAIRLFDACEGLGIDLETHIRLKVDYNKTRPKKHGKEY